jgi:hypothetical protein
MLSVTNKPNMVSVILLSVIMLNVVAPKKGHGKSETFANIVFYLAAPTIMPTKLTTGQVSTFFNFFFLSLTVGQNTLRLHF